MSEVHDDGTIFTWGETSGHISFELSTEGADSELFDFLAGPNPLKPLSVAMEVSYRAKAPAGLTATQRAIKSGARPRPAWVWRMVWRRPCLRNGHEVRTVIPHAAITETQFFAEQGAVVIGATAQPGVPS